MSGKENNEAESFEGQDKEVRVLGSDMNINN
jgi:hypothetical protein